jgi:hypothetical protein
MKAAKVSETPVSEPEWGRSFELELQADPLYTETIMRPTKETLPSR